MRSDCRPVTFTKEQGVVPQYTKGFCKTIQLLYDYTGSLKENYCLLVCVARVAVVVQQSIVQRSALFIALSLPLHQKSSMRTG